MENGTNIDVTGIDINELRFAAKYPFSKIAKGLITREYEEGSQDISIDFETMKRAKKRVINGIRLNVVPTLETDNNKLLREEILSYPVARMIASLLDRRLMNKYLSSELKRVEKHLSENDNELFRLVKEFGIESKGFNVDLKSYLKFIPKSKENRLVNCNIQSGAVILDMQSFISFTLEAVRRNIERGMPVRSDLIPKEIKKDVEEAVNEISGEIKTLGISSQIIREKERFISKTSEIAPCMKKLMEKFTFGENVPHAGRWILATYLLKIGYSIEDIISIYSNAPNFNEKITRYQIESIKKKGYMVPSCSNIDSYGLCIEKCGTKNPLQYHYKRRDRLEGKRLIKEVKRNKGDNK